MRRRAKVDANQPAIVRALRGYGCLVAHTHAVGGGFPDLIVAGPKNPMGQRIVGLVEVKDGERPPSEREKTPQQVEFWDQWEGAPMALVTDVEGALRFARILAFV